MLILLIISAIIGLIVSGLTKIALIGWLIGGFFFVCGLPGALIGGFIHNEITYVQDREDYRQMMSEVDADRRAEEHEFYEDERTARLTRNNKGSLTQIYNDKRQVHIHGGMCDG
jgi:hypothetical protein